MSSAERVRRFRDRQRQANLREPLWRDLTGKLNVAATWLGLGNAAPASFADAIQAVAAKIGLKLTDEPPAADSEPPRPALAPKPPKAKPHPTAEERTAKREREQAEWSQAYTAATEFMTLYEDQVMPHRCAVVDRVWTENVARVGLFKAPNGARMETTTLILERTTKNGLRYERLWFKRCILDAAVIYEACSRYTWTSRRAVKTNNGDTVMLDETDTTKHAAALGLDLAVWSRHPNKDAREKYLKGLYRRLAGRHHPDKEGGDAEQFRVVQVAYEYFTQLTHLRYFA